MKVRMTRREILMKRLFLFAALALLTGSLRAHHDMSANVSHDDQRFVFAVNAAP